MGRHPGPPAGRNSVPPHVAYSSSAKCRDNELRAKRPGKVNGGLQGQSQSGTLARPGGAGQRRSRSSHCQTSVGRRMYQPGPLWASGRPAVPLHARVPGVCVHKLPGCGA